MSGQPAILIRTQHYGPHGSSHHWDYDVLKGFDGETS